MERSEIRGGPSCFLHAARIDRAFPDFAEFIIGPAHRVRPLAGPMAGSGRTRWHNPHYFSTFLLAVPA
jgi:hypothetical protein